MDREIACGRVDLRCLAVRAVSTWKYIYVVAAAAYRYRFGVVGSSRALPIWSWKGWKIVNMMSRSVGFAGRLFTRAIENGAGGQGGRLGSVLCRCWKNYEMWGGTPLYCSLEVKIPDVS